MPPPFPSRQYRLKHSIWNHYVPCFVKIKADTVVNIVSVRGVEFEKKKKH